MGTKALLVYESELSFVKYSNLRLLFNMLSILPCPSTFDWTVERQGYLAGGYVLVLSFSLVGGKLPSAESRCRGNPVRAPFSWGKIRLVAINATVLTCVRVTVEC